MLYPRQLEDGELVHDDQMVHYKEHLAQNHRILFLSGAIGRKCPHCRVGETESPNLLMALDTMSHDPIKIVIDSLGGDLDSTFLFYDVMKFIKSPVITIGMFCASAACLLLAAGTQRYLFPHAKVMLHLATGQMGGDYKDFEIQHQLMVGYQDKIIDILQDAGVKKSRDEILVDIDRDLWLAPQEAIDYGLADEIITPDKWQEWIKGEDESA